MQKKQKGKEKKKWKEIAQHVHKMQFNSKCALALAFIFFLILPSKIFSSASIMPVIWSPYSTAFVRFI